MLAEQDWIMWALRAFGSCTAKVSSGVLDVTLCREPAVVSEPRAATVRLRETLTPDIAAELKARFASQGMMRLLGAELVDLDVGRCVLGLSYRPELSQQHGHFYGGVIGAIADVAGGYAVCSVAPADTDAVTVEYKLSIYAPVRGRRLEAVGEVLRAGRLSTSLVSVFDIGADDTRHRCATALQTVARISRPAA